MRTGIVVVLLGVLGAGRAHAQPGGPETAPPAQPTQPAPTGTPPAGAPPPVNPAPPPNYPPPPPAYYPPPPPRPMYVQQPVPVERQRRGLILLGDLGFAGHSSGRNGGTVTGGGLNVRGAIGVMATPYLALLAGASYFESTSVTIEQGGTKIDTDKLTLSATSFFLGGRIYTASSFYFDGTLGTLKQTGKDESIGFSASSDTGVIGHVGFGKEWWLQSGLGVGLGARLGIGSVPVQDGGDDPVVAHFDFCFNLSWSGS